MLAFSLGSTCLPPCLLSRPLLLQGTWQGTFLRSGPGNRTRRGGHGRRPGIESEEGWEPRATGRQRDWARQGGLQLRQKDTEPPAEAEGGEALSL